MEQFTPQDGRPVKEKSVYLLHLDGPRVLMLSALIIGLLTLTFLIGMKISNSSSNEDTLTQSDSLLESPSHVTQGLESDPSKDQLSQITSPNVLNQVPVPTTPLAQNNSATEAQKSVSTLSKGDSDLLAGDTIHKIDPPTREVAKVEKKKSDVLVSKVKKAGKDKSSASTKKKKSDVLEVSADDRGKDNQLKGKSGYVLQVASFDSLEIAKKEVSTLKGMNYDSFVDKAQIKGKQYFRVRIGPIASKEKALQMLDEIQSNDHYAETFVIRQ